MPLDPEFATYPYPYIHQARISSAIFEGRRCSEPVRINAELLDSPEWIREEIAGLDQDVKADEDTMRRDREELPKIEREILICERDIATNKLKIYELRAKLAAKSGGQQ